MFRNAISYLYTICLYIIFAGISLGMPNEKTNIIGNDGKRDKQICQLNLT